MNTEHVPKEITRHQFLFTFLAVLVLIGLSFLLQSDIAKSPKATGQVLQGELPGFVKTVLDPNISTYSTSAAAVMGRDNRPVVVYYEGSDKGKEVRFIRCGNLACTSNNVSKTLVTESLLVNHVNVRISKNGNPVVGYVIGVNRIPFWPLDYVIINCGDPDCTTTNRSVMRPGNGDYLQESVLNIGIDGNPIILAGIGKANGDGYPSYKIVAFRCLDPLCKGYETGIADIASSGQQGNERFESIDAILGADGFPILSYFHVDPTAPGLYEFKFLKCGDNSCASGNEATIIDPAIATRANTLVLGADGLPRIFFIKPGSSHLDQKVRVVTCGNPACNSGNTTASFIVEYLYGHHLDAVIPSDGLPVIIYRDSRGYNGESLYLAKCIDPKCLQSPKITLMDGPGLYRIWFSDNLNVGPSTDHVIATDNSGKPLFVAQIKETEQSENSLRFFRCLKNLCQ